MVAAAIRTIFAQPDAEHVRGQLDTIAGMLGRQLPKVESMLRDAAADITAFADFPVPHWKKIWSTNPNGSTKRSNAVPTSSASFPTPPHCYDWPARCSLKPTDEWQVADKRYLSETTLALLQPASDAGDQSVAMPAAITA
jgi:putative transposase